MISIHMHMYIYIYIYACTEQLNRIINKWAKQTAHLSIIGFLSNVTQCYGYIFTRNILINN